MDLDGQYKITDQKIGSGSFSTVYLGIDVNTNKEVAIKKIDITDKKNVIEKVLSEIDIMKKINHTNIVGYYDCIKNNNEWYLVLEYCNADTLNSVIKYHISSLKNTEVEENTKYYMTQLKDALNYLRISGYIHRDIKPMNILLKGDVSDANFHHTKGLIIKLADFGLAKDVNEVDNSLSNTVCGSPLYMAPELLIDMKYNSSADLWSYGVILYELIFGTAPTNAPTLRQFKSNIKNTDINFHDDKTYLSNSIKDLLHHLLSKDIDKRITWNDFFNHVWFQKKSEPLIFNKSPIIKSPQAASTGNINNPNNLNNLSNLSNLSNTISSTNTTSPTSNLTRMVLTKPINIPDFKQSSTQSQISAQLQIGFNSVSYPTSKSIIINNKRLTTDNKRSSITDNKRN